MQNVILLITFILKRKLVNITMDCIEVEFDEILSLPVYGWYFGCAIYEPIMIIWLQHFIDYERPLYKNSHGFWKDVLDNRFEQRSNNDDICLETYDGRY